MRIGAVRALDVADVSLTDNTLTFRHRPDDEHAVDTPLKNGTDGERIVSIDDTTTTLLGDYIADTRDSHEEADGRVPLVTTRQGRVGLSSLRRWVYRWTQPCQIGTECPHDTTPEACDTAGYTNGPHGCPSIVSPHAIRKLTVVTYRREEIPDRYIQDRCNVSEDVLDKHYDIRDEEEKAAQREDYFT